MKQVGWALARCLTRSSALPVRQDAVPWDKSVGGDSNWLGETKKINESVLF